MARPYVEELGLRLSSDVPWNAVQLTSQPAGRSAVSFAPRIMSSRTWSICFAALKSLATHVTLIVISGVVGVVKVGLHFGGNSFDVVDELGEERLLVVIGSGHVVDESLQDGVLLSCSGHNVTSLRFIVAQQVKPCHP